MLFRRTGYILAGLFIMLSGCAGFKERFRPEEAAWAGQKGDKILAVQAYELNDEDPGEVRCDGVVKEGLLMPDTAYFRDWMRVLDKPAYGHASLNKQAAPFVRKSPNMGGCRFVFRDIPAGMWLFRTSMQHHVRSHPVLMTYPDGSSRRFIVNLSPSFYIWKSMKVEDGRVLTTKEVINHPIKEKSFSWLPILPKAGQLELRDWSPSAVELRLMDLNSFVAPDTPIWPKNHKDSQLPAGWK